MRPRAGSKDPAYVTTYPAYVRRSSPALRCCLFLEQARAREHARQRIIPLVACRFENEVLPVVLERQRDLDRPGAHERRRVVDGGTIEDHVGARAREAFGQFQVFARALKARTPGEIRRLDDQRVPFPAARGVTHPLADAGGRMRLAVERDHALRAAAVSLLLRRSSSA